MIIGYKKRCPQSSNSVRHTNKSSEKIIPQIKEGNKHER